jgi:NAD(P)-dependent dehydrogenase (short-subunit alcohol dehydrogenase family)
MFSFTDGVEFKYGRIHVVGLDICNCGIRIEKIAKLISFSSNL